MKRKYNTLNYSFNDDMICCGFFMIAPLNFYFFFKDSLIHMYVVLLFYFLWLCVYSVTTLLGNLYVNLL